MTMLLELVTLSLTSEELDEYTSTHPPQPDSPGFSER